MCRDYIALDCFGDWPGLGGAGSRGLREGGRKGGMRGVGREWGLGLGLGLEI